MEEVWKDVVGYEGLYQVSNLGRIKHLSTYKVDVRGREWRTPERILNPTINNNGYYRVALSKNGKCKHIYVHRLIATAFIPNPFNKPCIDHINTNRLDNSMSNLRWVTQVENMKNPLSQANVAKGRDVYLASHRLGNSPFAIKIVGVCELTGETLHFDCIKDTKSKGFSESHVAQCIRKERVGHKGYKWYKYDEYQNIKCKSKSASA